MTTTTRPAGRHQTGNDRTGTERPDTAEPDDVLPVGTTVEVRSRFDRRWSRGFSVDAVDEATYRLRRTSDGAVLPARFRAEDVRAARTA